MFILLPERWEQVPETEDALLFSFDIDSCSQPHSYAAALVLNFDESLIYKHGEKTKNSWGLY